MRIAPKIRFEQKIMPEPMSGCWLWDAYIYPAGYGQFRISPTSRSIGAHRAAWILYKGPIPEGMMVCHKCDVPSCVNPDHLFLGTASDNMADAARKGRMNWKPGEKCALPVRGAHHMAKLTEADVIEIRRSADMGVVLADRYGVTPTHITRIRQRKTWRTPP